MNNRRARIQHSERLATSRRRRPKRELAAAFEQLVHDSTVSHESLRLLQAVLDVAPVSMSIKDTSGKYIYVNAQFEKTFGIPWNKAIGRTGLELFPDANVALASENEQSVLRNGRPEEWQQELGTVDGQRTFLTMRYPLRNPEGEIVALGGLSIDISERIRYEQQLAVWRTRAARAEVEESRNLVQNVIDGSPTPITIKDLNGRYLHVNKAFEEFYGISSAKAVGHRVRDFFPERVASRAKEQDEAVLTNDGYAEMQYEVPTVKGDRILLTIKFPLADNTGEYFAVSSISMDVTERVEMEERKSDFINMASHELRTPVTSIKVFHDLAQAFHVDGENGALGDVLDKMGVEIHKLERLIAEFLNLTHIQSGTLTLERNVFVLNEAVSAAVDREQGLTDTHRIVLKSHPESLKVVGDRKMIEEVIRQLLENAAKYSPAGSDVVIGTSRDDGRAVVWVQDFGVGIDVEDRKRIFERFYQTTRPELKTFPGFGIGLYLASEIVRGHAGEIRVESKKGHGSTFSFRLPLYA